MKRIIGYAAFGLVAYVGLLVATFPADRALAMLKEKAPAETQAIRVAGLTGSVWSGKIGVLQINGQRLDRVTWQLKPWHLLTGSLGLSLNLAGKEINGTAELSLNSNGLIHLSEVDLRLPGDRLSDALNLPVDLGGLFTIQLDEAQLQGNKLLSITGQLSWSRAAVISPIAQSLGEYHAVLSSDDNGIHAEINDVNGPLQLAGIATLATDGRYKFDGTVLVRDTEEIMLVQGVRALGRPASDGRVPLKYSGKL